MKSKFVFNRLTVSVAALLIAAFALALPILPKEDFSVRERRALAVFPSLTLESLLEGRFFASLSTYYADHFPLREPLTALKTATERSLGMQESNGIVFAENGYLIARGEHDDLSIAMRNLEAIGALTGAADCPITVSILPRAIDVMTAYLPYGYSTARAEEIGTLIGEGLPQNVDLTQPLREAAECGEAVFYRTDHHWTSEGAYLAYRTLAPSLGIEPYAAEQFSPVTATEHFLGTSFARAGLSHTTPDTITLYRYEGDDRYTVTTEEGQAALYDVSALGGDDPYEVFLGGNFARVTITDNAQKPTLLLFKDSFANALVPFLARHFQLVLVDPRYEQTGAATIIEEIQPDRVLVLIGADTLATTPALVRLGR